MLASLLEHMHHRVLKHPHLISVKEDRAAGISRDWHGCFVASLLKQRELSHCGLLSFIKGAMSSGSEKEGRPKRT